MRIEKPTAPSEDVSEEVKLNVIFFKGTTNGTQQYIIPNPRACIEQHNESVHVWRALRSQELVVYNTAIGSLIESVIVLYSKQMSGFKRVLSAAIRKRQKRRRWFATADDYRWILEVSLFNQHGDFPPSLKRTGNYEHFSPPSQSSPGWLSVDLISDCWKLFPQLIKNSPGYVTSKTMSRSAESGILFTLACHDLGINKTFKGMFCVKNNFVLFLSL